MLPRVLVVSRVSIVGLLCVLWCSVSGSVASTVRPVNLEQMSDRAASIFSGRCVDVSYGTHPTLGVEVTLATFEVERSIKGDVGETVTVTLFGGRPTAGNATAIIGRPNFAVGEDLVLFLYGESSAGLSSPVGLGQGKFNVFTDKQGNKIAVNEFGNKNLFRGMSTEAKGRLDSAAPRWLERRERELRSDLLLDMADSLKTLPATRTPEGE